MNDLQIPKLLFVITRFYVVLGMFEDFEFEDKFNPWSVGSLDGFLFYCCPECDSRTVTKSDFIRHAKNNHPRSQDVIDSFEGEHNQVISKAVTNNDLPEEMEIEETKLELTKCSFVTEVNHEIIKVESNNLKPESQQIPTMKTAKVCLTKLSDKVIKSYTKVPEMQKFNSSVNACLESICSSTTFGPDIVRNEVFEYQDLVDVTINTDKNLKDFKSANKFFCTVILSRLLTLKQLPSNWTLTKKSDEEFSNILNRLRSRFKGTGDHPKCPRNANRVDFFGKEMENGLGKRNGQQLLS